MRFRLALLLVLLTLPAIAADALPRPTGAVLLTISGSIAVTNAGKEARFDRAMLEKLGVRTMQTSTTWTTGVKTFEGVLARDVMKTAGAKGTEIRAIALNDYAVMIPMEDFERYDVLLAFRMDGQDLTARDKGPLWVVYPRDAHRELNDSKFDARWAWQLKRLDVK
ncbi:molybdopterin-dependent oxidoreductase [Ramlibacter sp.]|uniref:molybdopterin-dependent oxidoreductase n=1 Tax=Ramlibacter sp. TaxID=1917967 RepID=UPI003D11FEC5